MTPELAETLAALTEFPQVLDAIHRARYTGRLTLDFYCGVPQQVELPAPPITPVRIPLGKAAKRRKPSAPLSASQSHSPGD